MTFACKTTQISTGLSLKVVESLNKKKKCHQGYIIGDMKHSKFSYFGDNPNTILWLHECVWLCQKRTVISQNKINYI